MGAVMTTRWFCVNPKKRLMLATQALTPMAKAGLIDLEENMETDA